MTIDDKIRGEKLQYDINREAAKISVISSGKINKYDYLTYEEILQSDQSRIIEQSNFTHSSFKRLLKKTKKQKQKQKQSKKNEDQGIEQV